MHNNVFISALVLVLTACGGNDTPESSAAKQPIKNTSSSKLSAFMSEDKVCDVLPVTELKAMFEINGEVSTHGASFSNNYTCTYMWDPVDKEAREAAMIKNAMANASGKGKKMTMRQRAIEHQIGITLSQARNAAASFMPAKLTQAQLDAQIEQAQKAAADRLTAEQKEIAGDATQSMVAGMLKKNNQNEAVDGVGEAAYWSKTASGGLYVLDGGISVYISPMISKSEQIDMDYAKQIFNQLIK